MNWTASYQNAADRHRERARAAQAAHLMYAAALHERAAEILDAEIALGQTSATVPAPARSYPPGRRWLMTGASVRLQATW